jgi:hypothetical protein
MAQLIQYSYHRDIINNIIAYSNIVTLRVLLLNLCLIISWGRLRIIEYYPLSETVRPLYITIAYTYIE